MVAQSKLSNIFSYQTWIHAVSGAAGGVIAMTVFYPLDTVRCRLQLENTGKFDPHKNTLEVLMQLIREEGITSLYRGLGPVLQSLCISNFVYFYTFHGLKSVVMSSRPSQNNALKDLLLGSIAGVVNVLLTTPFWVVNTRLKMRGLAGTAAEVNKYYKNLISGLRYIALTEGISGLWSGTVPSLMLVCNPALHFMMYETLKRHFTQKYGEITGLSSFIIGALAKAFSTVLTYPLQLVQTKQRHRGSDEQSNSKQSNKNLDTIKVMMDIIRSYGVLGLYRGMEAKILQTVLTAALMFSIYEKVAKYVAIILKR